MKISSASLFTLLIAALDAGHAFAPLPSARGLAALRAVDESSAQALSDYMAKSHVEKLKAIKEVEAKKNAEIDVSNMNIALDLIWKINSTMSQKLGEVFICSHHVSNTITGTQSRTSPTKSSPTRHRRHNRFPASNFQ